MPHLQSALGVVIGMTRLISENRRAVPWWPVMTPRRVAISISAFASRGRWSDRDHDHPMPSCKSRL